jgi:ABC-type glycerol-3-phosphate transport system permease component
MRKKKMIHGIAVHAFLIALSAVMLYPLIWMFLGSFKENTEVFSLTHFFPTTWHFENYINGWFAVPQHNFGEFFLNSFIYSGLIVVGTLISCTLAAYPFARLNFKGRNLLFALVLATLMLPSQILLIPRYILFTKFGWTNSPLPLVVPSFFAQTSGAFCIYMLVQFMRGIPKSLEEAATVDGCGFFKRFFRIILPNCKPPLFTVAIFSFIWSWDDFLNQLIYLDSSEKFTVALALRMFNDSAAQINWGEMFAMAILSLLPMVVVFASAQKYFVEGITTSGLK